jgi:hypothetical protein
MRLAALISILFVCFQHQKEVIKDSKHSAVATRQQKIAGESSNLASSIHTKTKTESTMMRPSSKFKYKLEHQNSSDSQSSKSAQNEKTRGPKQSRIKVTEQAGNPFWSPLASHNSPPPFPSLLYTLCRHCLFIGTNNEALKYQHATVQRTMRPSNSKERLFVALFHYDVINSSTPLYAGSNISFIYYNCMNIAHDNVAQY